MNQLTIDVSDEVRRELDDLAEDEGVDPASYLARRVGELVRQASAFRDLQRRVRDADPDAMRRFLDAVPDVEPPAWDRLPEEAAEK